MWQDCHREGEPRVRNFHAHSRSCLFDRQALAAAAAEQARLAKAALEERAQAAAEQKRLAEEVWA